MDMIPLEARLREKTEKARALRRSGSVPCVLYGNAQENVLLTCPAMTLQNAFVRAGESTLVELNLGARKIPVLFHALDRDPVTDRIRHVDFYAVDLTKEVEATVSLHFEGESSAVKELGGILVTPMTHVRVKCLPENLPHHLPVSITSLTEMHAVIAIGNIPLPEGVTVLDDPESVVATIQEPRAEEEIAPPAPAEGEAATAAEVGAAATAPPGEAATGLPTTEEKNKKE